MTVLPSRRGTLQSVGTTSHVNGKCFDTPFGYFIGSSCMFRRQRHPRERCSSLGCQFPQHLSLLIPSHSLSPKQAAPLPREAVAPLGTVSGFWGKNHAQRSPRQDLRDRGLPSLLVCQHWHMRSLQGKNNLVSVAGVEGAVMAQIALSSPCAHKLQSGEERSEGAAFLCVSLPVSLSKPKAVTSTGASPVQLWWYLIPYGLLEPLSFLTTSHFTS